MVSEALVRSDYQILRTDKKELDKTVALCIDGVREALNSIKHIGPTHASFIYFISPKSR